MEEELQSKEEESFRLQGKMNSLEMKLDSKERDNNDAMNNLHLDWENKFDGMCEEYEQRLELV